MGSGRTDGADRVRDEAERLVATAIAALSYATRGFGAGRPAAGYADVPQQTGRQLATGSPECCVCPVCRAIAAMRDPSPDLADRLAAGVGDLATGVTAILRTLSQRSGRAEAAEEPSMTEDDESSRELEERAPASPAVAGNEFWENLRRKAADAARAAARGASTVDPERSTVDDDPWRVATAREGVRGTPAPTPAQPTARKAVAKKAVATQAVAKKAVAKKAVAKKAVAKKAVAKKAVAKTTPAPGASPRGARDSRAREDRGASAVTASDRDTERRGGVAPVAKVAKKAVRKAAPPEGAA